MKHYKVVFHIDGKRFPFSWFTFATDKAAAGRQAETFLREEFSKGFYRSGYIVSIKQL